MEKGHILLAEDNEGDILLTKEAFDENKVVRKISVVKDGEETLKFLFKSGKYANAETPDLILLDVNLPKKNGHDVLRLIKENPKTKSIPVIMLSTSSSAMDVAKAYQYHANSYISKPTDINSFMEAIRIIEDFWFKLVKLPIKN